MQIESVAVALPSRKVTNEDVVNEFLASSTAFTSDIERAAAIISRGLRSVGSQDRFWLGEGETPLQLILRACNTALDECAERPDLVIYAGVHRLLTEPSSASLVAHKLGLNRARAFDMTIACDSWMMAMEQAQALMRVGPYRRVMIVNGEFSMLHGFAIRPSLFAFENAAQLEHRFPIFTIGEAATATIVVPEGEPWRFTNQTHNDLHDLCTVVPAWFEREPGISDKVGKDGAGRFTSWAAELSEKGIPLTIDTFRESGIVSDDIDILFTHAHGTRDWVKIATEIGLRDKLYDIHPKTGNLVSASAPAAIALAMREGRLDRGTSAAILYASAGMTFTATSFIY